jgi:hypothetical protein
MRHELLGSRPLRTKAPRREAMLEPEDVSAMIRLKALGWGHQTDCPRSWVQPQRRRVRNRVRRSRHGQPPSSIGSFIIATSSRSAATA